MDHSNKLALLLVLAGVSIVLVGVALSIQDLQPVSATGGAVIFIGPIPIFIGWGAPTEVTITLIILMIILTIIGLVLFRFPRGS